MTSSEPVKVDIFGVPLDLGSKPLGVEMGPMAIRHAGLAEALRYNGMPFTDHGDIEVAPRREGQDSVEEIARVSERLAALVAASLSGGRVPVVLGGDHSASLGSIAGAARRSGRLGLLWLDCHPDANTPETSPSGSVHGMTVAAALGRGDRRLVDIAGAGPKVLPGDLCIVGAKDIDRGERQLLAELGVSMFTLMDIERHGIVEVFERALEIVSSGTRSVHVSFDVDVLDSEIAPGTGIVSRGGLTYREISFVMEGIGRSGLLGSLDIIEVNPLRDVRNRTAELAVELMLAALGGSYGDYERRYLEGG